MSYSIAKPFEKMTKQILELRADKIRLELQVSGQTKEIAWLTAANALLLHELNCNVCEIGGCDCKEWNKLQAVVEETAIAAARKGGAE